MILTRRLFIRSAASAIGILAAPAIVRVASIMPVKVPAEWGPIPTADAVITIDIDAVADLLPHEAIVVTCGYGGLVVGGAKFAMYRDVVVDRVGHWSSFTRAGVELRTGDIVRAGELLEANVCNSELLGARPAFHMTAEMTYRPLRGPKVLMMGQRDD